MSWSAWSARARQRGSTAALRLESYEHLVGGSLRDEAGAVGARDAGAEALGGERLRRLAGGHTPQAPAAVGFAGHREEAQAVGEPARILVLEVARGERPGLDRLRPFRRS